MNETTHQSVAPAHEPTHKLARKPRRMAREPGANCAAAVTFTSTASAPTASAPIAPATQPTAAAPSRLDQLQALLTREEGASIAEMTEATGWQQHSVRGAMAGALKKRGLAITSDKTSGVRRYHAEQTA